MHAYFMYIVGKTLIQTNLSFCGHTMSTIDLDRLIVRRTYFIPLKSSRLRKAIEDELNSSRNPILGILPWGTAIIHGLDFHFVYDMEYGFLESKTWGMDRTAEECQKLLREGLKEYKKKGVKAFHKQLRVLREELPRHVYVRVIQVEKNGCQCKVECLPALYDKLTCFVGFETNDFEIQNACLESRRFLETIFESGLSATLVSEEVKEISKPISKLLINSISSDQISRKIETMLNNATGEILIFAWIGTIHLKKLRELKEKGVKIRVITGKVKLIRQDPMRKEKELAMKELIQIIGKDHILIKPEFHGRSIIVDNKALIGSMDLDSYSLTGTRIEFATYTEDVETVRKLRNYFNQIFTPLKE